MAFSAGEASFSSTIRTNAPAPSRTMRPSPWGWSVTAVPSRQAAPVAAKVFTGYGTERAALAARDAYYAELETKSAPRHDAEEAVGFAL